MRSNEAHNGQAAVRSPQVTASITPFVLPMKVVDPLDASSPLHAHYFCRD
jgi:hypothetical protein